MNFWESSNVQKFLDALPFGIILQDSEDRTLRTNKAFSVITGYGISEIPNREILIQAACPDADDRDQVRASLLQDRNSFASNRNFQVTCKNGRRKWIRFYAFPVDPDQSLLFLVDMTQEKETKDRLWESQARFRDLVETIRDFVWETDAEGHCTYASPSVLQTMGYRPDEVLGRKPYDFIDSAERERVRTLYEAKKIRREPFVSLEYTSRRKDGRSITLESNGVPYFDQEGVFLGYRGVDRNVSSRKAAEDYVQRRRRYMNQAQRMIHLGSWDWDLRKKENYWSEELYRILGYAPGEVQPNTAAFFARVHPDDRDWLRREYDKLLANEPVGDHEFRVLNDRGDERTVFCRCHEERDDQGRLILLQGVFLDITQQKQTELQLRNMTENLERIVAERTAALTGLNEALRQEVAERKLAEHALEAKSRSMEEINITMRVLLQQQDEIRSEIANNVLLNLKQFVQPYLARLRETGLSMVQTQYLDIIATNLTNVSSPFLKHLAIEYVLTPKELQVAGMIRDGRTSRDISRIMRCSRSTIDFHRNSIRVKLGISNKRANLRHHLMSMK